VLLAPAQMPCTISIMRTVLVSGGHNASLDIVKALPLIQEVAAGTDCCTGDHILRTMNKG
jgi:hypothetical protein